MGGVKGVETTLRGVSGVGRRVKMEKWKRRRDDPPGRLRCRVKGEAGAWLKASTQPAAARPKDGKRVYEKARPDESV